MGLASEAVAHAAPPLPEPGVPQEHPLDDARAPTKADSKGDGEPKPTGPFAPPASLDTNPVDLLPRDTIYPPISGKHGELIRWRPEWSRFSTADWIITGTAAAITIGTAIIPPMKKHAYGGVLFDESARNALRLPTTEGRYAARDSSDVLLSLEATWPFFVDAVITTWWYRQSSDAATQMALVDGEALSIVTAIQGVTNTFASRERPYGRICGTAEQPGSTIDCEGNVRYRSFFSGHTAFSFMGASLICVHHMKLGLLGDPGDTIACVTAYAGAAATGAFRVMGDMHYVTDVLVGAGVGTLVGLGVPLLHYRRVNLAPGDKSAVDVHVVPHGAGLGLAGTF